MQPSLGMRIALFALVGAADRAQRGGLADEYVAVETNCFPCSCCCFAKGLRHVPSLRRLTVCLSCLLKNGR